MEIVLLLIRFILFGIFAVAGVGKLLDLEGSEKAVKAFGAPEEVAKPLAVALPLAEIIFAVCLLFVETSWLGAIGALILLLTFIGGILVQMAQGNAPDCHCFGVIHSEPVSKKILIRNIIFAMLAFILILSGKSTQGANLFDSGNSSSEGNFMSFLIGLATVGLLAAVVFYLKKISEQQTQIMRRIEIMEVAALDGTSAEIKREGVTEPAAGILIGTPAPEFSLPDINDKIVTSAQLFAQAKPTLLLFVSPTCAPCALLLPDFEAWQNELRGNVEFVFLSSGKVEDNLKKFAGGSLKQILLQDDREVGLLFGAEWTPAAVLVSEDGTIASKLAVGDQQIRGLIDKIKDGIGSGETLLIAATNGEAQNPSLGKTLPEFALNDVFDRTVTSQSLLGKKTLVTFWSTTCVFCNQMLDDLRDWDKTKGMDEPNLLVLSEGEPEKHKDFDLNSPIVLDVGREVSNELGMEGTPSAVLINENGRIISETAVGAEQIWTLIGKKSL